HLDKNRDKHALLVEMYEFGVGKLAEEIGVRPPPPGGAAPDRPHTLLHRVLAYAGTMHVDARLHKADEHKSILDWIRQFLDKLIGLVVHEIERDAELRHLIIVVETALSLVIGIVSDDLLKRGFLAIDDEDFIEWLARHGCRHAVSPLTIGMYDACFGYQDGE